MKKILIAMVMMVGLLSFTNYAKAQEATLMPLVAGDSTSTSTSLDTVSKVIRVTAGYSAIGIQVVTTKISGTVAGKAYLYGSLDGTNYEILDSSAAFANQTTNSAIFKRVTSPHTYLKVQVREADGAATTQVNRVRVYYVLRRHN